MKDDLLEGIPNRNYDEIKYHVNTCYPRYVRSRERFVKKTEIAHIEDLNDEPISPKIDLNGGGCRTLTLPYLQKSHVKFVIK